jgi:hypothetical protein
MRAATSISTGAIGTCTCRRRAEELWIDAGDQGSRIHLAFQAADRAQVDAVHTAGVEAGGQDNGKPGERPYHPGYYAAFLTDPDGNNIEAVFHGPAQRSTDSVVLTFEGPKAG